MGRPSQKGTLKLSNKVKIYKKLVKMKKKDAYLHGISTACVNPLQHELIQFTANISNIYDFKIYIIEHRLPVNK